MTALNRKKNLVLTSLNQWFYINQLILNIRKSDVIKFIPKTTVHVPSDIYSKDNLIDEVKNSKFLGMHIDIHMNWKSHVEQILPKLSAAYFSIRSVIHTLNPDTLYGLVCILSFCTSVWNNLLGKFNVCASII